MQESIILSRNEDVSDYVIGGFCDERLMKTGALLFKRICNKMNTCIKQIAGTRALQMAFSRFLQNKNVSSNEIEQSCTEQTNNNCANKKHVLCIQDTVTITFPKQNNKKSSFGSTNNKGVKGLFSHPGLVLDAENRDILGLSSIKTWTRNDDEELIYRQKRKIEEKESYRWIETAEKAKCKLSNAGLITIIGDRESDIYELFDRIPDEKTHLLIRSNHNRNIHSDKSISEHMASVKNAGSYEIHLPKITGQRKSRNATISVKYSKIKIKKPKHIKSIQEYIEVICVEATEENPISDNESPVLWRILTTHTVEDLDDAKQIIDWYTCRWTIEQVFRTMKKKGFNIEETQMESVQSLLKLLTLCVAAAVKVMCLVHARDGGTERPATDCFEENELVILHLLLEKVEGKTQKQKNPYSKNSLSWASWIIARLGGWNGYQSESPPGPITMYRGLDKFHNYMECVSLMQQKDMCIG